MNRFVVNVISYLLWLLLTMVAASVAYARWPEYTTLVALIQIIVTMFVVMKFNPLKEPKNRKDSK